MVFWSNIDPSVCSKIKSWPSFQLIICADVVTSYDLMCWKTLPPVTSLLKEQTLPTMLSPQFLRLSLSGFSGSAPVCFTGLGWEDFTEFRKLCSVCRVWITVSTYSSPLVFWKWNDVKSSFNISDEVQRLLDRFETRFQNNFFPSGFNWKR